jgi:hypothetical protein
MIYEFDVSNVTAPYTVGTATTGTTASHSIINDNYYWYQPYTTYPYTWTTSTKVYMYQLICPKCKTTNWGEIDQVVTCTGVYAQEKRPGGKKIMCEATLKAVSKHVDFEVPVG